LFVHNPDAGKDKKGYCNAFGFFDITPKQYEEIKAIKDMSINVFNNLHKKYLYHKGMIQIITNKLTVSL